MLSDSSHPQEQTPPKVFSSPTNAPRTGKNGLSHLPRHQIAYGSSKTLLPNKMSLNKANQKTKESHRETIIPSSEKVTK